ncbi:MAG: hypothetical protein HFH08_01465 [Bacilli bacterium]|nr:hypothetical protein [Bacilli bacterium]
MKFLEKVKNMFTEEVEEEITPVKTEVRKVEIPVPVKPIEKEEEIPRKNEPASEVEVVKKEEKPKAPVFFDDKDFDKLPTASNVEKKEEKQVVTKVSQPKPSTKLERKEAYGGKSPAYTASTFKEEKKTFKPTPIISPVYGVLDKNYRKDDIAPKKRVTQSSVSKELTVDDIRNKAFGTLEDELETTLFGSMPPITESLNTEEEDMGLDLFDELEVKESQEDSMEEIATSSRAERNRELELLDEVDGLEQMVINERPEFEPSIEEEPIVEDTNQNMIEDEMDKICSEPSEELENDTNLTESDLFNLIDSMYEKKEGEE